MCMQLQEDEQETSSKGNNNISDQSLSFLLSSNRYKFAYSSVKKSIFVFMASRGAAAAINWAKKGGAGAGSGSHGQQTKTTSVPRHIVSAIVLGIVGNNTFLHASLSWFFNPQELEPKIASALWKLTADSRSFRNIFLTVQKYRAWFLLSIGIFCCLPGNFLYDSVNLLWIWKRPLFGNKGLSG